MDKNSVYLGDCLDVLEGINNGSIDLIYLDPPFFTNRIHKSQNRIGDKSYAFDDFWENHADYGNFLIERLKKCKGKLKDTGSIFVHCDRSGEHIVRAALDLVFGEKNFQSEVVWIYKRWSNSRKGLLPAHQNIYFYSKTKDFKFNRIFTEYSETTNVDQILQSRVRDSRDKSVYARNADGDIKVNAKKKGVPLSDVWDIPYLNPKAKERTGYPTQKPILLLEKIITLTTDEGDLVLDPFCGSGTTCVAAKLNQRDYIGIDISSEAVELTNNRLLNPFKTESDLLKKGRKSYKSADYESLKLLGDVKYNAVARSTGIDAILCDTYEDLPILVRIQKPDECLDEAYSLLLKSCISKKSKKSFLISTTKERLIECDPRIVVIYSASAAINSHL